MNNKQKKQMNNSKKCIKLNLKKIITKLKLILIIMVKIKVMII